VVELVGAAGAGKSTLVAELQRRDPSVRWLQRVRAARAGATLRIVPAWLAAASRAPLGYAWRNARFFLRLAALEEVVRRAARDAAGPVLLEHGPVFTLARLRAFHAGPMPGRSPATPRGSRPVDDDARPRDRAGRPARRAGARSDARQGPRHA
jgi:predicted ATPase